MQGQRYDVTVDERLPSAIELFVPAPNCEAENAAGLGVDGGERHAQLCVRRDELLL